MSYSSSKERQHLIDKLAIAELASLHDSSQDVRLVTDIRLLAGKHELLLLDDDIIADTAQYLLVLIEHGVGLDGNAPDKPFGEEKVHAEKDKTALGGL